MRMTVLGERGQALFSSPLHLISQEKAHELLSVIAVRLPEGVSIEARSRSWITRSMQLAGGLTGMLPLALTVVEIRNLAVSPFNSVWSLVFNGTLAVIGLGLVKAALTHREEKRGYQPRSEYREALFPYISWWFIGAPIPGSRAFQYREGITRADVSKAVWRQRMTIYLVMTLPLITVLPVLLAQRALLSLWPAFLLAVAIPCALILFRFRSIKKTLLLGSGLTDEILLDETGISVWRQGELAPALVVELPEISKVRGPLQPSLTLKVSGKLVEFDSTAMQVIEIS